MTQSQQRQILPETAERLGRLELSVESLRKYFESLINERELRHEQRFKSTQEALTTAFKEMERRLEALNHLREEVNHDRSVFLRADIYNTHHKSLQSDIDSVQKEVGGKIDSVQKEVGGKMSFDICRVQTENQWEAISGLRNDVTAIKTRSSTWFVAIGIAFTVLQVVLGVITVYVLRSH